MATSQATVIREKVHHCSFSLDTRFNGMNLAIVAEEVIIAYFRYSHVLVDKGWSRTERA